jgi:hypothetical protein
LFERITNYIKKIGYTFYFALKKYNIIIQAFDTSLIVFRGKYFASRSFSLIILKYDAIFKNITPPKELD